VIASISAVGRSDFSKQFWIFTGFHALLPICLLTSFAYNWHIFGACRLVTGFVCGGVTLVQYVYTQEMVGREWWILNGELHFTTNMLSKLRPALCEVCWARECFVGICKRLFCFANASWWSKLTTVVRASAKSSKTGNSMETMNQMLKRVDKKRGAGNVVACIKR